MRLKLLLVLVCILSFSCTSRFDCASESLVGEWNIISILRIVDTQTGTENVESSGNGSFIFSETQLEYTNVLEDIPDSTYTVTESYPYTLEITKENAGFFNVHVYDIKGETDYRVTFGDDTSDAHCEATMITLKNDSIFFRLEKI